MIKESTGKICEGIYALGNPDLPAFLFGGEIPALFDAGMTFMGPIYLQELKTYLGDAGKLRYLLLTHSHFDHCGGAPFLKKENSGPKNRDQPASGGSFPKAECRAVDPKPEPVRRRSVQFPEPR